IVGTAHPARGARSASLVRLAQRIERPTGDDEGRQVLLLDDLRSDVVACAEMTGVDASRLLGVLAQLSKSSRSGHVLGISGLVRETKLFAREALGDSKATESI